ncbi:aspartate carbamoyltransferase regulatory subunit [Clostridium luticellarii]|jgi:aspartate carbamoyltransferase regulatory subunit|uniref:Aspartate carbamoyltransferase regulatory chain n=1 Tax=Clostridium luticellarii TaxID=1691940 RepID=A0A2T0BQE8_9CLOT|nr:aspartate carbamoyltransferase regulatory subunit [Clostridium luticellarii]MCI1944439.1 aspartate carbamoyltransferase regulatory subunit [Clostridium luticellarii]MCI1967938.1 aspartate carbamoyltransferase regulatory subunit [Clostridium luticellarii]MCI1995123.1 aspartate carbamoyltransferase regulatory subunit [Clostridium luticellarii]MCI2039282.1 aspartate carbamoyltransferase regulatory subunit [Clostridium luticellarii]PRR86062.1 Aspartate carbamoyltransferase regulatory chain [Clo
MLTINSIKNGIVIDHIKAGFGMKIYKYLELDKADYSVALIMNAESSKLGKKDIIKIENNLEMDFAVLGFIDPNITIDIIKDEKIYKKIKLKLPTRVENIIKCKNPRCVTSVEKNIPHIFNLVDEKTGEYRCAYCDQIYQDSSL